ncbi:GntR family transcriptional regulator [Allomesorhizobium camelthorni]|uniref:GntR family transcriptional regulator n=1 Tax=Allomesorhizobium camelthorni TaxID=475069 RepID=UPI001980AF02
MREELLQRIEKGTYQPGKAIPSTAMLSEDFGVSPITIKRAIRDLQALGLLTGIAGKGTFVKVQKRFLLELDAFSSPFSNATVKLLSVTRERITDPTMQVFKPPQNAVLCVRKIVLFGDDAPVMYDATYVSADLDEAIIDEFGERLVTEALRRHSIEVFSASQIIDAAPAAGQPAEVFGVPNGYPMLRRLYKVDTSNPDITIYGVIQAPFDRMACSLNVRASETLSIAGFERDTIRG